ncbi:MAG TPA: MOSC domain-containing protein [Polyangiaceae bacterium]|jgi:hypothetical protein|nr:MOSC domain-containing protein [Polyangiaceae bacterium]
MHKAEPSKEELLQTKPDAFDSDSLRFDGPRGDRSKHLSRQVLVEELRKLPAPPREGGTVDLMVARGPNGERLLHEQALLTPERGMPNDRWAAQHKYGIAFQLATTRHDVARLIANGQPTELHGDNLYLTLDLSSENLPAGSQLRMGQALLCVTPQPHNGCKKYIQRFGLAAMQLNLDPEFRAQHLRGIYLQVLQAGIVRLGDAIEVLTRGA